MTYAKSQRTHLKKKMFSYMKYTFPFFFFQTITVSVNVCAYGNIYPITMKLSSLICGISVRKRCIKLRTSEKDLCLQQRKEQSCTKIIEGSAHLSDSPYRGGMGTKRSANGQSTPSVTQLAKLTNCKRYLCTRF